MASLPPRLTAYHDMVAGRAFSLDLERDARGAWNPVPDLDMPLHHASTIAWQNRSLLDGEPARDDHAAAYDRRRVTVIATGLGRTSLEHDRERGVFFATYAARIERVCADPPP